MKQSSAAAPGRAVVIIPARLASTRLPRKPLADICGRPMLYHVWTAAAAAARSEEAYVTTPDPEIAEAARDFGARVVMTGLHHRSGTDRVAEAAELLGLQDSAIVVNAQGDEPLLPSGYIDGVVGALTSAPEASVATLMCSCPEKDLSNPNCVKVVAAVSGRALYFSRSTIPSGRGGAGKVMQHIGLYAYRTGYLKDFARTPPTPLEIAESLEQLRALEMGAIIQMEEVGAAPPGVNTPDELERVRKIMAAHL